MENSNDTAFLRTSMGVMGVLFAIFFGIIFLAHSIGGGRDGDPKLAEKLLEERIAPVAKVATDASQVIKPAAKAHVAQTADQIVNGVCGACHSAGMLGAPKLGDKAEWAKRKAAAGGEAGLVSHAVNGIRQMPARGGNPDLTDDEIKSAVELMLQKSGA